MDASRQPLAFGGSSHGFEISLPNEPEASATARRKVDSLGDRLPPRVLADLRTILTELISNCVDHGTDGEIAVAVEVEPDGRVHGAVSDGGSAPAGIARFRSSEHGGLGLRIVDALASHWGVDAPTSDVWFEIEPPANMN